MVFACSNLRCQLIRKGSSGLDLENGQPPPNFYATGKILLRTTYYNSLVISTHKKYYYLKAVNPAVSEK